MYITVKQLANIFDTINNADPGENIREKVDNMTIEYIQENKNKTEKNEV